MTKEIEITEDNFNEYFFDVRMHSPKEGQIIARYNAIAELIDGNEKRQLLNLLKMRDKAIPATQVLRKLLCCSYEDSISIAKEIIQDLLSGMEEEEILYKPYKYNLEMHFYTDRENLPKNDPHWSSMSVIDMEDLTAEIADGIVMESKMLDERSEKEDKDV